MYVFVYQCTMNKQNKIYDINHNFNKRNNN